MRKRLNSFLCGALLLSALLTFPSRVTATEFSSKDVLVTEEDLISLLSLSLGGHDMGTAAWASMTQFERSVLRDRAITMAKMATAAQRDGVAGNAEVTRLVKWASASILADAWHKKTVQELDMSESALRKFYDVNSVRYVQAGEVRYRYLTFKKKNTANNCMQAIKRQKKTLGSQKSCRTTGWLKYDEIDDTLREGLLTAPLHELMGPQRTAGGYIVFEVIGRKKEGPLPFEQCRDKVKNDLTQQTVKERLASD